MEPRDTGEVTDNICKSKAADGVGVGGAEVGLAVGVGGIGGVEVGVDEV